MEFLAKLSFQETAYQGDTGGANQRIPGSAGKGMVPLGAKLWFKAHVVVRTCSLAKWEGSFCH